MLIHWNSTNTTERAVLDIIRCYSVKYGAAHLKLETIEKAIKKSDATVQRVIRKLVKLDIIERIHYIRPVLSGLSANIYVIKTLYDQSKLNSPAEAVDPSCSEAQPADSQTQAFLSKAISSKILKRTSPPKVLPTTLFSNLKSFLPSTIGER